MIAAMPTHPSAQAFRAAVEARDLDALRAVLEPILVVQGSRDSLGPLVGITEALEGVANATLSVVEGGDHSYRTPGGRAATARLEDEAVAAAVEWLESIG